MADERPTVTPPNKQDWEPATFYGQEVMSGDPSPSTEFDEGFFQGMGRGASMAWEDVKHRWDTLSDSGTTISKEEFDEVTKDAPVQQSWGPSMTRERAEFLAQEARHAQWSQQFDQQTIARFVGEIGPTLLDPTSVATMPFGGANFARGIAAGSLKQYLKETTVGGLKVGAATAPLEATMQPEVYGEMRPGMLAAAAGAPVVASPILNAPARVLSGIAGRSTGAEDPDLAAAVGEKAGQQGDMQADVTNITSDLTDSDAPAPPLTMEQALQAAEQVGATELEARGELDRWFGDWPGKERGWVRDLAAGDEAAARRAEELGIDADSPALQRFLTREGERTASRSRVVDEDRFTQARDFQDFVRGQAAPEQRQRLAAQGLVESAEAAALARQTPEDWRLGETLRRAREADAAEADVREMGASRSMKPLQDALETPAAQRTAQQEDLRRAFMENGAGAARAENIDRLKKDYEQLLDREQQATEDLAEGRQAESVTTLQRQREETAAELEAAQAEARTVQDGQFNVDEFVAALEAARMESKASPLTRQRSPLAVPEEPGDNVKAHKQGGYEGRPGETPDVQEARSLAEQQGEIDTAAIDADMDRIRNLIEECRNG